MRLLDSILGRLLFGPPRITHNPVVPNAYPVGHKGHPQMLHFPPGVEGRAA